MQRSSKRTKHKSKHIKTETFHESESIPFEFGKPVVRLPIISKKTGRFHFRYENSNSAERSLDSKNVKKEHNKTIVHQKDFCTEQAIMRKYSNNSQLQLLTFEELELCADKSRKILPKIAITGGQIRQNTERCINEEFHKRLNRIKSEKKIDSNSSELCCYKLGAVLGRGHYSIVKLCETNEKKYAAKIYPKLKINSLQRQLNLKSQINVMKSISHTNIIGFKEYVETDDNHYIIMELFDNISLLEFMRRTGVSESGTPNDECLSSRAREKVKLPENIARTIMKGILKAFQYLHGKGIAHRDVKLENILISQNKNQLTIKVIDFGFSCRCLSDSEKENKDDQSKGSTEQRIFYDYCGTPSYIAPEITTKKGYKARAADVWALGVLLYFMTTGSYPFKVLTEKSEFSNSLFLESGAKLSSHLVTMLKKILRNDPNLRPTVDQLLNEIWMLQK